MMKGEFFNFDEVIRIECDIARIKAIDETISEILKIVEGEENWLYETYINNGCKYTRYNVDTAFQCIKRELIEKRRAYENRRNRQSYTNYK